MFPSDKGDVRQLALKGRGSWGRKARGDHEHRRGLNFGPARDEMKYEGKGPRVLKNWR